MSQVKEFQDLPTYPGLIALPKNFYTLRACLFFSFKSVFEKNIFYFLLQINFLIFLNRFDMLMFKINLNKKNIISM
jgi:hypothetical protein